MYANVDEVKQFFSLKMDNENRPMTDIEKNNIRVK